MKIPAIPSPYPTLRKGKSIYHPDHLGFVNAWNWMRGIWQNVAEYFVGSVNGVAGDVSIVGGNGIQVITSGSTITINVGDGEDENHNSSGGGSDGGSGSGSGGGSGGGSDDVSEEEKGSCNDWSNDFGAGREDYVEQIQQWPDICKELNGW